MDVNKDRMLDTYMAELLQVASIAIGLPVAEVEALLGSELETNHLLVYITAVMADRMN
jgi:hypothetical protein